MKSSLARILVLGSILLSLQPARAACEPEVLSASTARSVRVRMVSEHNVCNPVYASPKLPDEDPCISYPWFAAVYQGIPGFGSGVEVRFVYSRIDECNEIVYAQSLLVLTLDQSYLDSHPEGIRISSTANVPTGAGAGYNVTPDPGAPPLAVEGTVTWRDGVCIVDVTFTGGTPPPDLARLVDALEAGRLSAKQKRPLHAALDAARRSFAAGECRRGISQLRAFQQKVRAQLGRTAQANALIAEAQKIIDAGCD